MIIGIAWKCSSELDRRMNNEAAPIVKVTKHFAKNNMKSPILLMAPNRKAFPTTTCQA